MTGSLMSPIRTKDGLDRLLKQVGHRKGQRQTGIVLAGLNRIDRLPGNTESPREVTLGPAPLRPEHPESVGH